MTVDSALRQSHRTSAYIGLGSNQGLPEQQIRSAMVAMDSLASCRILSSSSLYRSRPLPAAGVTQPQADYINAVICLETSLSALALLSALQAIETAHGRIRGEQRWGPRTLDLDILLFGQERHNTERLTIPHVGLPQRDFVLYPLFEIEADLMIPGIGTLHSLLQACPERGLRRLMAEADGQNG